MWMRWASRQWPCTENDFHQIQVAAEETIRNNLKPKKVCHLVFFLLILCDQCYVFVPSWLITEHCGDEKLNKLRCGSHLLIEHKLCDLTVWWENTLKKMLSQCGHTSRDYFHSLKDKMMLFRPEALSKQQQSQYFFFQFWDRWFRIFLLYW